MIARDRVSLEEATALAVACIHAAGCAGAASAKDTEGWRVEVRGGAIELVKASTTRQLHLLVYAAEGRMGSLATGDLTPAGIRSAVAAAVELAGVGDPDPWAGLAPPAECGLGPEVDIRDPEWRTLTPEAGARLVAAGEAAAQAVDPRIRLSDRCSASSSLSEWRYATTDGVELADGSTAVGFGITAIAQDGEERQMGWRSTNARHHRALRSPAQVGAEAGARAIARFGWRRVPSGPAPVVLDTDTASEFLWLLMHALDGGAIYRRASWCVDRRGQALLPRGLSIIDDPHRPRARGSRRCDGEGVRSRRTAVVEDGQLQHYLVGGYAARRLGHPYTGHASGTSNVALTPGTASRDDLLAAMGTGLLVTDFNGWGVDIAAGTFSRGASGFWVEGGRIAYPVQEVTLAGRLAELWQGVRLVGNDPDPEDTVSSPSLLIEGFTIGGR